MKKSYYHLGIILLYLLFVPLIFIFIPGAFNFSFKTSSVFYVSLICIISLSLFFLIFRKELVVNRLKINILSVILYSILIAFSEEIIFRGIIQGFLQKYLNFIFAILISSSFFGVAHFQNGAKSFSIAGWNWKFIFMAFLAGIPLGLIFFISESLFFPFIFHSLLIVLMTLFLRK